MRARAPWKISVQELPPSVAVNFALLAYSIRLMPLGSNTCLIPGPPTHITDWLLIVPGSSSVVSSQVPNRHASRLDDGLGEGLAGAFELASRRLSGPAAGPPAVGRRPAW